MIAQQAVENVFSYTISGTGAALLFFLLRRWSKQRDDAAVADIKAREEERKSCDERILRVEAQHARALDALTLETTRLRRALAAILPTLDDKEARARVMRELWPTGEVSRTEGP